MKEFGGITISIQISCDDVLDTKATRHYRESNPRGTRGI